MSAFFDRFGKQVRRRDGVVNIDGRLFWSPETMKLAGQWVTVMRPKRDDTEIDIVVIGPRGEELRRVKAQLIEDTGFASFDAAHEAIRRIRDEFAAEREQIEAAQTSIVGRKIVALVQLMDERIESQQALLRAVRPSLAARMFQAVKHFLFHIGPAPRHGGKHGDLQVIGELCLQPGLSEAGFEAALTIFDVGEAQMERFKRELGFSHGGSPVDAEERNQPADAARRLSGVAE